MRRTPREHLQQYLDETRARLEDITPQARYSVRAMARDLGVSHHTLQKWLDGSAQPSKRAAADIERRTGGALLMRDLAPYPSRTDARGQHQNQGHAKSRNG